jgi:hypothetical protein
VVRKSETQKVEPTSKVEAPVAMSAKERLAAKARKKPATAAEAKTQRDTILLDQPEQAVIAEAVDRLTASTLAYNAFKGHKETSKSIVVPPLRMMLLKRWIAEGRQIDNPKFQTPSGCNFILQCKDTLTGSRGFRAPKDKDGDLVPMETHLASFGIPKKLIERLTESEEFKDETTLSVNFAKLEKDQPSLASRLMDLIDQANTGGVTTKDGKKIKFTDDEITLILEQNNDVTIKEDFLKRSVGHVKAVAEDDDEAVMLLDALLRAIPPQWAVGQTLCVNAEEMVVALLKKKNGEEKTDGAKLIEHETPDGKYTIRQEGTNLTIFRNADKKELCTKHCNDLDHAANGVRDWKTNPGKLMAFIADHAK